MPGELAGGAVLVVLDAKKRPGMIEARCCSSTVGVGGLEANESVFLCVCAFEVAGEVENGGFGVAACGLAASD